MEALTLICAIGIPSALCGFAIWLIERKIQKSDKQREKERMEAEAAAKAAEEARKAREDERDKRNEEFMMLLYDSIQASLVLSEATARAVQRIPDAKCNGDMHAALEVADRLKEKQQHFVEQLGVESLYRRR